MSIKRANAPASITNYDAPMDSHAKLVAIAMALFAAFGGVTSLGPKKWATGSGFSESSKAMGATGKLSTASDALVTSILSVGTFTGALLAYPFGDFCVALQTASTTVPVFSVGRVFAGLGVGLISCLVPMYQSECAPKWIRGAIVSCYQWAITIGLLVAAIVVQLTKDIDNPNSYRIPIGIQFVWAFILSMGLYFLPESPKYLILKGREQEAKVSLGRLLSLPPHSDFVQKEFEEVNESLQTERIHASSSYMDCFRSGPGKYRLRTLTGMSIQALQQLSGFFRNSGINNAFLTTIITNVVNVLMTIPGIWLVDKAGRRSLLLIGAGPIAWVVTSEIYPLSIRAKAMSMSTASNWAWNFAIGYSTPYLVDTGAGKAGLQSKVFFIWGAFCALCFLFTFFFIPETKGLSLEQVDQLYMNSSIIGSNAYRRKLLTGNVRHSSNDSRSVVEDALEEKTVK
ncbi:and other transporter-domain-containing protein [Phakopsora pachyrhizi]|uniref:And other transporter-domain-containing protein n=1 Tax=Phakopsora pachyrhizi TaxID=170000 RepID=A0AAV0AXT4_PHAPC|nr:and other transporter-domain-containing protein [Phakopsora pachyrhizi]